MPPFFRGLATVPEFIVCSKSQVKKTVKRFEATHLVTTLDVGDSIFRPVSIPPLHHLRLSFDDEEDPQRPHAPQLFHAESILNWGSQLPPDARVVIHCFAGQCRSTAVGLALWLQANGLHKFDEARAWLLDHRSSACPNLLLAKYFDQLLLLDGTFLSFCDKIGEDCMARWWKNNVPD